MKNRFLRLLKNRTLGGSRAPTATQLNAAADTVFMEPANYQDILQVSHVNQALQATRQNNGIPKGSLSVVESVTVSDSETDIVKPTGEQVYLLTAITPKAPGSGSDISFELRLSDGTSSCKIYGGTAGAGGSNPVLSVMDNQIGTGVPLLLTSGSYLVGQAAASLPVELSYHVLQS